MTNGKYKWLLLALLGCAYYFHQADRALFGILTPYIQNDLGLSGKQIGWINTVLSWTIAAVTPLAGLVGNRFSRKWIITISLAFWSLATMAMGFVGDWHVGALALSAFAVVMFLRSLATGGGESFYGPAAMALLASYHEKTRSTAFSIHQAALYVGLMTSGLLAAWALGAFGSWRNTFIFFGACGIVLAAVFVFALRDRPKAATITAVPIVEVPRFTESLKAFFLNPPALLATTGFIAIVFVNNSYLFWAPKFAHEKFAVSVGAAGTGVMLWHHLAAFAAILAGGVLTDRMVMRYPKFRIWFQIAALVGGAPTILGMGSASSWPAFLAVSAAYGLFRGAFEVNTHATVFDFVPARYRSSTVGYMLLLAFFIGGLFSGWAMGVLFDRYGLEGFEIGCRYMAGAYVAAAVLMGFALRYFFTSGVDLAPKNRYNTRD